MIVIRTILVLFILPFVDVTVYVYNTVDSPLVELYDCIPHADLFYCRRPEKPISLNRSNSTKQCYNDGIVHFFSYLRSSNISISTVLHQWSSSIDKAEQYSRYIEDSRKLDDYICQCTDPQSFGKNCEYVLLEGSTFAQTLNFENTLKASNSYYVQRYGDIICYMTLDCNSGLLCLDWRDICDGLQQCMSGLDEENCDKLEFNECENDEYRCMNGMCIPEEYFLDGTFDCLDWSDEIQYYDDLKCSTQGASIQCDDRICPPYHYSCGDGQCIFDRFDFQNMSHVNSECRSRREQYFICETHYIKDMWTLPNGRCHEGYGYNESSMSNLTINEECEYILLCDLSGAADANCPCGGNNTYCAKELNDTCRSSHIQYPRAGIMAPYVLFYHQTRYKLRPDYILINGTIKCDGIIIYIPGIEFPFTSQLRQVEDNICQWAKNRSLLGNHTHNQCSHQHSLTFNNCSYNLTNVCNNSTTGVSIYRIKDGFINCVDKMDETANISISEICSTNQRYRFRCSGAEPTCLSVTALGNHQQNCANRYDELWFGTGSKLSDIYCNNLWRDQCKILRQYIEDSWTLDDMHQVTGQLQIPFRYYCDTFWDLDSKEDENVNECRDWWICPEAQWQCRTGQCIAEKWTLDGEWDCPDASDEGDIFYPSISDRNLRVVDVFELVNRSAVLSPTIPFSKICNLTNEFPCLVANISNSLGNFTHNQVCINREHIGNGRIDCYGGIDERNNVTNCDQLTMLGYNFKCHSNNQCIPYRNHCLGPRCHNSSDDQFWCNFRQNLNNCYNFSDAVCFNGTCVRDGRCNRIPDCSFGEDEYMCEFPIGLQSTSVLYRKDKEIGTKHAEHILQWIQFPTNSNITNSTKVSPSAIASSPNISTEPIVYWCNRGISVQMYNDLIACFCPPQYYGDKCEFHADRITVLVHLNLSQSIYTVNTDMNLVLKLLVLFLFNNQTIANHLFHVRPATEIVVFSKKMVHLLYSRSFQFLQHKKQRYFNRSNIINDHPYSIRIEIYERKYSGEPYRIAIWQYPIYFDYLPVFRLAKVLRLTKSNMKQNPCLRNPCNQNQECYQLLNEEFKHICLCKSNFSGENCSIEDHDCINNYCSVGSLCKPNYRGLVVGNNRPYCICPFDRFGERCNIKYDRCLSNPCVNQGSCFVVSKVDAYVCLCTEEYHGNNCELGKSQTELSINESISHAAAVIQFFDINFVLFNLVLAHQMIYRTLPTSIKYLHKRSTAPEIVLVKLYSSQIDISAEVYLISVHIDVTSISAITQVTEETRCVDVRTLILDNMTQIISDYSPIKYHYFCRNNTNLLCFKDNAYLCICSEKHDRVDCFNYDNKLNQCSQCLAGGRCIKGDPLQTFICLCPPCYYGSKCQFNSNSFAFTLDQLFFVDLTSTNQKIIVYLLIIGSLLLALIALPNNVFSFVTFRRQKCLCNGIGQYLYCMSIINQINICVLAARLIHLSITIMSSQSHPIVNNIFCKVLSYSLACFTRMAYWLVSFVATERVYTTAFLKGQWLQRPHIARRLIILTFIMVFFSGAYEFAFVKSVSVDNGSMCAIEFPLIHQSVWMRIHQIVSISNSVVPLLINLCCTITIIYIIIKTKMNIHMPNRSIDTTGNVNMNEPEQLPVEKLEKNIKTKETRRRFNLLRGVLNDHKEMITRPAVTLVPSVFSLFSLPLFIASFSLGCQNLENSPVRYLLIAFYFISFIPQIITFFLYVYPSSLYFNEWHLTRIGQWITALRQQHALRSTAFLSTINEETLKNLSECKSY